MPLFLDTHHGSELDPDWIRAFLRGARSASVNASGVRPIELYCGDDGRVFLVLAAAEEASVRQQHAADGVVCRRVRPIETSHAYDELGEDEKTQVRHMIAAEHAWPAEIAS